MPRFDEREAQCRVFTFKDGFLSPFAHDLEIDVTRFSVEWDEGAARLEARFDPASLRVLHALKEGRPSPSSLSDRDRRTIEENIRQEVLELGRHPGEIRFVASAIEGAGDRRTIRGALVLHGTSRAIEVFARREGGRWIAETTLHQPEFGIKPYSAMMGALRVQPTVRVRLSAPAPGAGDTGSP
jgi:hypothetical protein